jgi:hypothetical protein
MIKPEARIRRFDVFAEYNRLKALDDGLPADEAKGYGLWLAKLVAARRFSHTKVDERPSKVRETVAREPEEEPAPAISRWRTLSGKPQTDELFDKEIVDRMGTEFYRELFAPAIRDAVQNGRAYTSIRDAIRREWKP